MIRLIFTLAVFSTLLALADDKISSARAKDHLGESRTVCGPVVDIVYLETISYLKFDKENSHTTFTVVLPETIGFRFPVVARTYQGKTVCVAGSIVDLNGAAAMFITAVSQIKPRPK